MTRRVLLIAHAFAPRHSMGALRTGKFVKYLPEFGWEPIVVTRASENDSRRAEEPEGVRIVRTDHRDRLRLLRHPSGKRVEVGPQDEEALPPRQRTAIRRALSIVVREAVDFPDEFVGWRPYALRAARHVLRQETFALLFSTSPPPTAHLIAAALQRETGLPWVADFRDLWTQNHYFRHAFPRTVIERRIEKRTLRGAGSLVTVSGPLADALGSLHGKPTEVITNGYDEDDYAGDQPPSTPYFSLTYTGKLYARKRDPSLVFEAVRELVEERAIAPEAFQVRFFGPERDRAIVEALAAQYEVQQYVMHGGHVGYREAVLRQRESTALLLLNWDVPQEKGVYTGKLFEYLGARRPVLAVPRIGGVVDDLLRRTNAGVVAGTKDEVIAVLAGWYDRFVAERAVAYSGIDREIRCFSRRAQTEKLAQLFDRIAIGEEME